MPASCVAYGCSNSSNKQVCKEKNVSFHRFPLQKPEILIQWILKIRREDFTPNIHSKLCSEHFEDECFFRQRNTGKKYLKVDAVPTKFTYTKQSRTGKGTAYQFQEGESSTVEPSIDSAKECTESNKEKCVQTDESVLSAILSSNSNLMTEIELLKTKINSIIFRVHTIKSDNLMKTFTGFNIKLLHTVFSFLNLEKCIPTVSSLSALDQFFLFLVYIRAGIAETFLSILFQVHQTTVSHICTNMSNIIFAKLKTISIWPKQETVQKNSPLLFSKHFPNCRLIIECTEFPIQQPSCPLLRQQTFSFNKNTHTLKALIGITPSGAINFISDLWSGAIQDKELFMKSGLLNLLEAGDLVLANKSFKIKDELEEKGCFLAAPNYLERKIQITKIEMDENKIVSHYQVYVERAINRIKCYKLFEGEISNRHLDIINEYFFIICFFINFGSPLINFNKL